MFRPKSRGELPRQKPKFRFLGVEDETSEHKVIRLLIDHSEVLLGATRWDLTQEQILRCVAPGINNEFPELSRLLRDIVRHDAYSVRKILNYPCYGIDLSLEPSSHNHTCMVHHTLLWYSMIGFRYLDLLRGWSWVHNGLNLLLIHLCVFTKSHAIVLNHQNITKLWDWIFKDYHTT